MFDLPVTEHWGVVGEGLRMGRSQREGETPKREERPSKKDANTQTDDCERE